MELQEGVPNGTGNQSSSNEPTPQANPSQAPTGAPAFQIDPRFQSLPVEEAIARSHQAIVTPLYQKIKELEVQTKKFDTYVEDLSLIIDNPEAKVAWIREIAPELIPDIDVDDQVKAGLDKKFGKDFKFDPDEAKSDQFSSSAKYQRYMTKLYSDIETKQQGASKRTYPEIVKEVKARKNQSSENVKNQMAELEAAGVSKEELNTFMPWAQKATLKDLYAHYKAMNNFTNGPNLTSIQGGPTTLNDQYAKVNNLFGRDRS